MDQSAVENRSVSYRIAAVTLCLLALLFLLCFWVVPALITASYFRQATPYLNSLIRNRNVTPLSVYLRMWWQKADQLVVCVAIAGAIGATLTWPGFQLFVDRKYGPVSLLPGARLQRRTAGFWMCAVVVGAQILDAAFDRDDWPLSSYSMYSGVQGSNIDCFRVFAVQPNGEEVPLFDNHSRLGDVGLSAALQSIYESGRTLELESRLRSVNRAYAATHGVLAGDGATALRLYKLTWRIKPEIDNLRQPDARELLYELPPRR